MVINNKKNKGVEQSERSLRVNRAQLGQIHMTETIVVLLIVFILLFAGIYIYYYFSIQGIQESGEDIREQKAQTQLQIISSMPEFSCTKFSCIDTLNLLAFKQVTKKEQYENTFGFKIIIIEQVYPETNNQECTMQNYPDCNKYTIYNNPKSDFTEETSTSLPTTLYFQSENQYKIGKIILTNYE